MFTVVFKWNLRNQFYIQNIIPYKISNKKEIRTLDLRSCLNFVSLKALKIYEMTPCVGPTMPKYYLKKQFVFNILFATNSTSIYILIFLVYLEWIMN